MRIAIMVICLGLFLVVGFQGCIAMTGGVALAEEGAEMAGSMGILLSLLFLVAGGFALKKPMVTAIVLVIGGILALFTGGEHYGDLPIWGGIAIILGVVSFISYKRDLGVSEKIERSES
ncbi:MAG: hypothetical protein D5R97_08175 [Candidatus Syntrophonatronum acetioxidans]|uniref:Lipoprotein n=1 Tax=Candidatus Syntrophonatronum acetioxidans TaxID=1795816 RepID=A0A424YC10_9FIRM|nr:MAG: hypothetical protein D5R97_08175 [Candidatus Syntrophonatronum acetioxidans]